MKDPSKDKYELPEYRKAWAKNRHYVKYARKYNDPVMMRNIERAFKGSSSWSDMADQFAWPGITRKDAREIALHAIYVWNSEVYPKFYPVEPTPHDKQELANLMYYTFKRIAETPMWERE